MRVRACRVGRWVMCVKIERRSSSGRVRRVGGVTDMIGRGSEKVLFLLWSFLVGKLERNPETKNASLPDRCVDHRGLCMWSATKESSDKAVRTCVLGV